MALGVALTAMGALRVLGDTVPGSSSGCGSDRDNGGSADGGTGCRGTGIIISSGATISLSRGGHFPSLPSLEF